MKKERKTQTSEVLNYLKIHKNGITSMQAFEMFGATRLASIIHRLRKRHNIVSIVEDGVNRYGESTSYCRYVLKEEGE